MGTFLGAKNDSVRLVWINCHSVVAEPHLEGVQTVNKVIEIGGEVRWSK